MVWHHEQAQAPLFPSRLFFYCEKPATTGGGTGVSPSAPLYEALAKYHPEFLAKCESLGVRYRGVLPERPDVTKGVGRSWKSFFSVDTKEAGACGCCLML